MGTSFSWQLIEQFILEQHMHDARTADKAGDMLSAVAPQHECS